MAAIRCRRLGLGIFFAFLLGPVLIEPLAAQPQFGERSGYVGSKACAPCHASITQRQLKSNMRRTWRSPSSKPFSGQYRNQIDEGPQPSIGYLVSSHGQGLNFKVEVPAIGSREFEVESVIGGSRFGVGFLISMQRLEGLRLARPALIETRYRHNSQTGGLGLTAGHPPAKPNALETVFGRVLTPQFQERCLACHGAPSMMPNGEPGISCEVCHGPGQPHLQAVAQGGLDDLAILNPANGTPGQVVEFCGLCHSSDHLTLYDPRPQDLLISNQAFSLRQSECFIQSGGQLDCIACHDPHGNARHDDPVYVETCKSCHGSGIQAATCPVNAQDGCIQCHMPSHREGDMIDHWIRVVPALGSAPKPPSEWVKSRVEPRRLFLRVLVAPTSAEADRIRLEIEQGGSFHDLARKHSRHPSAPMGGFLGGMLVSQMNTEMAKTAKALAPGQLSHPFQLGRDFALLYRMPRDFRSLAIGLEKESAALLQKGDLRGALNGYQEALRRYPHFLRALKGMGITLRKAGQFDASIQVLKRASRLYPRDADALYQLGLSHGLSGRVLPEIPLQRRAAYLNPELVPPRMRLGVIHFQQGRLREAARFFEEALRLKPLLGAAYYNLGNTRLRQGKKEEAQHALALAQKLRMKFSEPSGRLKDKP